MIKVDEVVNGVLNKFLESIEMKSPFQAKYLVKSMEGITEEEKDQLESLINFYMEREYSLDEITDAFLYWVKTLMEEQKYFLENSAYRYSSLNDAKHIYEDANYMKSYVIGLSLTTYLWNLHRDMMRFFTDKISRIPRGEKYLEIGPGHGEYFVKALLNTNFSKYIGVDISQTSVDMTKAFIQHTFKNEGKSYDILCQDFFEYPNTEKFDAIVMGEVLEHVEQPLNFLRKIHDIANNDAFIYITTAINAPQLDHIYLFHTIEEVLELLDKAHLKVVDYMAVTANNIALDRAIKKKLTITVAFILKKDTRGL